MVRVTPDDINWFNQYQSLLNVSTDGTYFERLEGSLTVDMCYIADEKYIIAPDKKQKEMGTYIYDSYQIKACHNEDGFIPKVYETDKRIISYAQNKKYPPCDLHVNSPDGNVCLCPKPQERLKLVNDYTLKDFFLYLVIPFFYAQSFFEKFDYWPWGDYSHGDMGILECYAKYLHQAREKDVFFADTVKALKAENQMVLSSSEQITRQTICFCGSGKKFRKCHPKAWDGIKLLKCNYPEFSKVLS